MQARTSVAILLFGALVAAVALEAERPARVRPTIPPGLDLYLPVPEDNELTPQRVALGRRLFFDPILSRDGSLACASCHRPERAFTDDRPVSVGVFGRQGRRRVPKLLNRAWGRAHFWDGRASTLEEQVLRPIEDPNELDLPLEEAIARLGAHADYARQFEGPSEAHPPPTTWPGRWPAMCARFSLATRPLTTT
ncbi:MAG: cytochrome-c peroxidase [Candidatus Acidiferrales bacterium]